MRPGAALAPKLQRAHAPIIPQHLLKSKAWFKAWPKPAPAPLPQAQAQAAKAPVVASSPLEAALAQVKASAEMVAKTLPEALPKKHKLIPEPVYVLIAGDGTHIFATGNMIQHFLLAFLYPDRMASPFFKEDMAALKRSTLLLNKTDYLFKTIMSSYQTNYYYAYSNSRTPNLSAAIQNLYITAAEVLPKKNFPPVPVPFPQHAGKIADEIAAIYYKNLELQIKDAQEVIEKYYPENLPENLAEAIMYSRVDKDRYPVSMLLPSKDYLNIAVAELKKKREAKKAISIQAEIKEFAPAAVASEENVAPSQSLTAFTTDKSEQRYQELEQINQQHLQTLAHQSEQLKQALAEIEQQKETIEYEFTKLANSIRDPALQELPCQPYLRTIYLAAQAEYVEKPDQNTITRLHHTLKVVNAFLANPSQNTRSNLQTKAAEFYNSDCRRHQGMGFAMAGLASTFATASVMTALAALTIVTIPYIAIPAGLIGLLISGALGACSIASAAKSGHSFWRSRQPALYKGLAGLNTSATPATRRAPDGDERPNQAYTAIPLERRI